MKTHWKAFQQTHFSLRKLYIQTYWSALGHTAVLTVVRAGMNPQPPLAHTTQPYTYIHIYMFYVNML
jgi:hypothetical protein